MLTYPLKLNRCDCAHLVGEEMGGEGGQCDSGRLRTNMPYFGMALDTLQGTLIHVLVIPVHSHLNMRKWRVRDFSQSHKQGSALALDAGPGPLHSISLLMQHTGQRGDPFRYLQLCLGHR